MKQIVEALKLWFLLHLPKNSRLRHAVEGDSREYIALNFWEAIAPEPAASAPWHFRDYKPVVPLTVSEIDEFIHIIDEHFHADPEEFA